MKLGKITDAAYNQMPQVRNSDLGKILKSWAHFKSESLNDDLDESKALLFGRAFHAFILEETVFWENFAILPEGLDRRTKEGKATYEALSTSGKTLISNNDWNTINSMKNALLAHIMARLRDGYTKEDCILVIDKKTKEWLGTSFEKFLRVSTLFAGKFDDYLNQKYSPNSNVEKMANYDFSKYVKGEI